MSRRPYWGMVDKDNPCTPDCKERSWDCHTRCERYKVYTQKVEEKREKISEIKRNEAMVSDFLCGNAEKNALKLARHNGRPRNGKPLN